MSPTPTVSILLPVRNGAQTLTAALQSLQAQTRPDFECCIVDDGSTDETPDIIRRFEEADRRFRGCTQKPLGIVTALNQAAAMARTHLLARQDADDVSMPTRLEKQLARLERDPDLGLVSCQVEHDGSPLTDGGRRYAEWVSSCVQPDEIANGLWVESPLPHPTVVLRRHCFEAVGGYRDRGWPEDYDLWLRLRRHGVSMVKVDEPLYRWVDDPGRASRTLPEYEAERFLACRVHHLKRYLGDRETVIWGAGKDGRRFARAFLAEGARVRLFLDIDPKKIGRRAHDTPIVEASSWLEEVGSPDGPASGPHPMVLAAVGVAGARDLIRAELRRRGWREGRDFLAVA